MKRIAVIMSDGFETVEALSTVDFFIRGGAEPVIVSADNRDEITSAQNVVIRANAHLQDIVPEQFDAMMIPGGLPNTNSLSANDKVLDFIRQMDGAGKIVAAICAGPMVLDKAGVLKGKKATIYPGMESYIASAQPTLEPLTKDGRILTGFGPAMSMPFAYALLEMVMGKEVVDKVKEGTLEDRLH